MHMLPLRTTHEPDVAQSDLRGIQKITTAIANPDNEVRHSKPLADDSDFAEDKHGGGKARCTQRKHVPVRKQHLAQTQVLILAFISSAAGV